MDKSTTNSNYFKGMMPKVQNLIANHRIRIVMLPLYLFYFSPKNDDEKDQCN